MCRIILGIIVALTPTLVLAAEVENLEKPAYLKVETVPDGVEIMVDNEIVGLTPILRLAFPSGEYSIGALFPGGERAEKNVALEAGTTTDVRFYSVEGEGNEKGWFSGRDALISFALVWGLMGFSILIAFSEADFG
jgi:hypothetical protein